MKCAIITPIGPGHLTLYQDAKASVQAARTHGVGAFSEVLDLPIDDTKAMLGRSAARNLAVRQAIDLGADWLFFLDADDLILPDAFLRVADLLATHDAIWGAICEESSEKPGTWTLRQQQDQPLANVYEVLRMNPFYSLQMGHFVRSATAAANPFDETLDTGEDFDYYLRLWLNSRCVKRPFPLFVNRRGRHSSGPRSANGADWGKSVVQVMTRFLSANGDAIRLQQGKIPL